MTLTPAELELIKAIRQCANSDGIAKSLYRIVTFANIDYPHAHSRLPRLEALGILKVERHGPGLPLSLKVLD